MKIGCMLVNYNNGTGSRAWDLSGGLSAQKEADVKDFLTLCLDSYFASTSGDCPLVVIDDRSTDDSCELIGRYEDRLERFIRNESNMGLNYCMNEGARILIDELGCDIICRFDGDIEFLTPGWNTRFVQHFVHHPSTGVVGGCQLLPFGGIWAHGDMLIHPEGYTHVMCSHKYPGVVKDFQTVLASDDMVLGDVRCDSIMGCLAAFRADAFRKVGGLRDEFDKVRGQTEDLNLRLMLEGYECVSLGGVLFIHRHVEHAGKNSAKSDSKDRIRRSFEIWPELWGWEKMKPDMRQIYDRWKGTPLVRNLYRHADGTIEYIGP